jgi:hypothetical protein
MAPESENNLRLEIGHVLFLDIVGYSKLLIEKQKERLRASSPRSCWRWRRARIRTVDRKPAFWKYGRMKTTLDLPDDLMHEVKIRAVHERKKLKDAIAEFLRKGLAAGSKRQPKTPKPVKLRGGPITTQEIEAAIAWGRD